MKEKSREDMINSVIGQGSVLKGTAEIQGSIRIDGEVEGNLTVSEALVVGKSGAVRADVKAKSVIVGGRVFGNITATKRVELESGSHMEGDVTTTSLVIAEGVFFQGSCRMNGEAGPIPAAAHSPDAAKEPEVVDNLG
jgi:cytoskeletal protein CcmA (bactofilin family)